MHNITHPPGCTACGVCVCACPVDAITMDASGLFYRPVVDEEKCIGCGLCQQICPVETPIPSGTPLAAWGGRNRDPSVVKASSSGGGFSALAKEVLSRGGVVYGACYSDDCKSVTIRGTDAVPLSALRKSKYVESATGDSYRRVKDALGAGKPVLYCAAPCQIAGLLAYLGGSPEGLYTCDFSCGGMPSHGLYRAYLQSLEERYGSPVTAVDFRPKTLGWEDHAIQVAFANDRVYHSPAQLDPYFNVFIMKHYTVRECCLDCPFAARHTADIVMADFWWYRKCSGITDPGGGLSLMIANSPKGKQLLSSMEEDFIWEELEITKACYNLREKTSTQDLRQKRQQFLEACVQKGFAATAEGCLPGKKDRLVLRIKSAAKRMLRSVK